MSFALTFTDEGWLLPGPGVVRVPTVRTSPLETERPIALVWHVTGGPCRPGYGERLARRIASYRRGIDRPASWHFLVDREGRVYQSAPLSVGTWHVGRTGIIGGQAFTNVNAATVGIELENPGRLRAFPQAPGHVFCWPYFERPEAPAAERRPDPRLEVPVERAVGFANGDMFAAFPAAQEDSATLLLEALAHELGRPRTACGYTHRGFDPGRRADDPGRLFEELVLPRMLDLVLGPDEDPTLVSPSKGSNVASLAAPSERVAQEDRPS